MAQKTKKRSRSIDKPPQVEDPTSASATATNSNTNAKPKPNNPPHPTFSTPQGKKWIPAILATRSHPSYAHNYKFTRFQTITTKYDPHGCSWITTDDRPYDGEAAGGVPSAIALDCEMCETTDPETGKVNPKALCRISVIDASSSSANKGLFGGEVLMDTLVKPDWPVSDYRTQIHGIDAEHLSQVGFTLSHAQTFMAALCCEETVVVGHAVQNDLAALRMVHRRVVDSALLFPVEGGDVVCSLRDLTRSVLGRDTTVQQQQKHDSVNDARLTLECIEEGWRKVVVDRKENVKPIVVAKKKKVQQPKQGQPQQQQQRGEGRSYLSELFVHRIPPSCTPEHIETMFVTFTNIKPSYVPSIEFPRTLNTEYDESTGEMKKMHGKVSVKFQSEEHANLAFETLEGGAKLEMSGRRQKKVYMKKKKKWKRKGEDNGGGDYVQIRSNRRVV